MKTSAFAATLIIFGGVVGIPLAGSFLIGGDKTAPPQLAPAAPVKPKRVATLPLNLATLQHRLDNALSGFSPFRVRGLTTGELNGKQVFSAKVGRFDLVGGVDPQSRRLAGVAVVGSTIDVEEQVALTAMVLDCVVPASLPRTETAALMRSLIMDAANVPGNIMTNTLDARDGGIRVDCVVNADTHKVTLAIEPTEILVRWR